MGRFYQFLKSTIVGGLLVLLPLGLLVAITVKGVEIARDAIEPLFKVLPFKTVGGVSLAFLAAILVLLLACFLAGLLAQGALTRRLVASVEHLILSRIPGYALMKSMGENIVGIEGKEGRTTLLVKLDDCWQIGFPMDTLPDGRRVVFLPDVPNAMSGSLQVFAPDRVEELALPISTALGTLARLGVGLSDKWPPSASRVI